MRIAGKKERKGSKEETCKKPMVALLVFVIATLEFLAGKKKPLDAKDIFRYIFLLFYCFARSVELCEIVYSNVARPKCVRVSLYLQASLSI